MKFTRIPTDTFQRLQLNSGILVKKFNPTNGKIEEGDLVGATSGGITFEATPTFSDYGEDIDNCPKNMKELKRLESWEAKMSGDFVSVSPDTAATVTGPADFDPSTGKVTPRNDVLDKDFQELWWVGDYGADNSDETGGYMAIRLLNSLSTGGFKIQSSDKGKGKMTFEFTGHYSMDDQDKVPFEIYVKSSTAAE